MRIDQSQALTDPAGATAPRSTRRLRVALGTWVAIEAWAADPPPELATTAATIEQAAIEAAYAAIGAVEQAMHPRRPGSDLARINSGVLHNPIGLHPDTWRVLRLAQRLHDLTDGVFDPCLPAQPGSLRDVELGAEPMLVCHAAVEIDLGGIAKGYAVDRAVEKLIEHGCRTGLVNAGGDLRVFGEREEPILLREADAGFRQVTLENSALAVSDVDATDRPAEHQGYYTRNGEPTVRRYAAVIAKDAATADALTKCVLFCSPEQTARALREFEAKLA